MNLLLFFVFVLNWPFSVFVGPQFDDHWSVTFFFMAVAEGLLRFHFR